MINITVITGSIREGRIGGSVTDWLLERLKGHHELSATSLDLADVDLPWNLPVQRSGDVASVGDLLAGCDAFIVVTPEYNHGYPAALKNLIDLYAQPWKTKPVALVSYGGQAGGLRAVEQLRLVFSELHAVPLRDTVCFSDPWDHLDNEGRFEPGPRSENSLAVMVERLVWWTETLSAGRATRQYD
jgi:NAD(P)H-dependent FMN reductase